MNPDPTSLDRLHDIVAPAPVPWWPPAPGWYWVLAFVAVVVVVGLLRMLIQWQRNRYRREALAELARQQVRLAIPGERAETLAALAALLKRTALSAWPRREVAALHGAEWFAFLDRTGKTNGFSGGHGALLESAAYDPRQAQTLDENQTRELTGLVRDWLKHHRVEREERSASGC